jgi:predicted aldo/keto reductase-like oxidoreductase
VPDEKGRKSHLSRRDFMKHSSMGIFGAGLLKQDNISKQEETEKEAPRIKGYRQLGRTGFKVSDIGTGFPFNEFILRDVLNSGVNFIETSEMYNRGKNEQLIGSVIKDYDREKLFIATKAAPGVREFESKEDIIKRAHASLQRLQTDYVDCYMIHDAQSSERVKDRFFHAAVEKLKADGKVRFVGLSCHGHRWWDKPEETMEQVMMAAIEDGRFDVLLIPYNFFEPEMGNRVLAACNKNNIGTMIMKSNPIILYDYFGSIKTKVEKEGRKFDEDYQIVYEKFKTQAEYAKKLFKKYSISDIEHIKEAALQFILSNKNVNTICCLFQTLEDVKKYVKLSGTKLEAKKAQTLNEFREKVGFMHCRIGCNVCEKHCPHHLPVNTILRYNYYFQAKGRQKEAMEMFRRLPGAQTYACKNCEGYCEDACPYGVATRGILAMAYQNLSFEEAEYA